MIAYLPLVACFLLSFVTATLLIRRGIPKLKHEKKNEPMIEEAAKSPVFDIHSTGFWMGFLETLLTFVFIYAGEFGALAIIIGAKQLVRKENIQSNPSYYLLGFLTNFSVALIFALLARTLV